MSFRSYEPMDNQKSSLHVQCSLWTDYLFLEGFPTPVWSFFNGVTRNVLKRESPTYNKRYRQTWQRSIVCLISLRVLLFYICKFEVNRDHKSRCAKWWSNLTIKCYANVIEKVIVPAEKKGSKTYPTHIENGSGHLKSSYNAFCFQA